MPVFGVIPATGGAMAIAAGVAGGMRQATLAAMPDLTAGFRRTAACQVTQYPPVRWGHAISELLYVRRAVAADDIRQSAHLQIRHHLANLLGGGRGRLLGHVGVDRGGHGRAVPEPFLNHSQINTRFEQMSRIAVA